MAGKQRHDDQRKHRGFGGGQPVLGRNAEKAQQPVEDALGRGVIQPQPHHGQRHAGGDAGQVVHGLENGLGLLSKGKDHHRNAEGDQQRQRNHNGGVDDRVEGRLIEEVEFGVFQGVGIVFQAHILGAEGLVVKEAGVNCADHGIQGENAENDHGGGNKNVSPQILVGEPELPAAQPFLLCAVHRLPPRRKYPPHRGGVGERFISRACRRRSFQRRRRREQPQRCGRRHPARWSHQPAAAGTWE